MPTDNSELLLEADELDFIAVTLDPACASVWIPPLKARGPVRHADVGREQVFD